jgi:NADH-quinone oxidoreductase subunit E/NADP-reducing hydrogenase subunit HndA
VQIIIAEGLDLPLSEIYGSLILLFAIPLNPKGKYQISICWAACYVRVPAYSGGRGEKLGIARRHHRRRTVFLMPAGIGAAGWRR